MSQIGFRALEYARKWLQKAIRMDFWKCNFPVIPHVRHLVGGFVIINKRTGSCTFMHLSEHMFDYGCCFNGGSSWLWLLFQRRLQLIMVAFTTEAPADNGCCFNGGSSWLWSLFQRRLQLMMVAVSTEAPADNNCCFTGGPSWLWLLFQQRLQLIMVAVSTEAPADYGCCFDGGSSKYL